MAVVLGSAPSPRHRLSTRPALHAIRSRVAGERRRLIEDLQARVATQTELPAAPAGWQVAALTMQAGGRVLGGDLTVARRDAEDYQLLLADVSGAGTAAAARAALFGAAASALLGVAPVSGYLPALNTHLAHQQWEDGFATGVHLRLDGASGVIDLGSAGHPAAIVCRKGGATSLVGAPGMALGVLPDLGPDAFGRTQIALEPGDACVLFTDGVVESAGTDLADGVRALARRVAAGGALPAAALARVLVSPLSDDDQTVVVLRRSV